MSSEHGCLQCGTCCSSGEALRKRAWSHFASGAVHMGPRAGCRDSGHSKTRGVAICRCQSGHRSLFLNPITNCLSVGLGAVICGDAFVALVGCDRPQMVSAEDGTTRLPFGTVAPLVDAWVGRYASDRYRRIRAGAFAVAKVCFRRIPALDAAADERQNCP